MKYRRALFLSEGEFKNKNKLSKGPDENYELAELINDGISEDKFQIKKQWIYFINNSFGILKKKLELETQNQANNQKRFEKRRKRL